MNIISLYFLLIPIIIYLVLTTPIINYELGWFYKSCLIYLGLTGIIFSILFNNNIINKFLLPFILFLNILILIYITFINKFNYINLIPLLGIIYLLYTFNYKDFECKNGILIKPNKIWIYSYIIILAIYFLLSDFIFDKFYFIIIVLYPIIFPLNEYFIHRIFSLSISSAIYWKYKFLF